MKAFFISIFTLIIFSCQAQVERSYDVRDFSRLRVAGPYFVTLLKGDPRVVLNGDEEIIENTTVKIEGSELVIRKDGDWRWNSSRGSVDITIYFGEISALEVSGACELTSRDLVGGNGDFDLEVSGASRVDFELRADEVSAEISGASTVEVMGEINAQELEISGASNYRASDLVSTETRVDCSGASTVVVNVTERLRADASGASSVRYFGNPKYVDAETSGASSVRGRN